MLRPAHNLEGLEGGRGGMVWEPGTILTDKRTMKWRFVNIWGSHFLYPVRAFCFVDFPSCLVAEKTPSSALPPLKIGSPDVSRSWREAYNEE